MIARGRYVNYNCRGMVIIVVLLWYYSNYVCVSYKNAHSDCLEMKVKETGTPEPSPIVRSGIES